MHQALRPSVQWPLQKAWRKGDLGPCSEAAPAAAPAEGLAQGGPGPCSEAASAAAPAEGLAQGGPGPGSEAAPAAAPAEGLAQGGPAPGSCSEATPLAAPAEGLAQAALANPAKRPLRGHPKSFQHGPCYVAFVPGTEHKRDRYVAHCPFHDDRCTKEMSTNQPSEEVVRARLRHWLNTGLSFPGRSQKRDHMGCHIPRDIAASEQDLEKEMLQATSTF